MQREKLFTGTNVLLALALMLFAVSFAVVLTLNFRPLYYADIAGLDIPALSGLAEETIRANYDVLIDYNGLFIRGELAFPSLPMSETGRIHFEEVKVIFDAVQVLLIASAAAVVVGCTLKLRRGRTAFLKLGAIFTVAVPVLVGVLMAVGWEWFFVFFYTVFFNNDYWIFDAVSDPVITILPDGFFLHCAIMIVALVLVLAGVQYLWYRLRKHRQAKRAKQPA